MTEKGTSKAKSQGKDGFVCLPYVDEELLCKIQSKVKKSGLNIRIAWKNSNKLRSKLITSSLNIPKCPGGRRCNTCLSGFQGDCTQKNVVYRLNCSMCKQGEKENIYIGETKRPVRLRFNEHVRDALHETEGTPIMGDHFREHHSGSHVPPIPLQIQVIYRARDHPDRKIAESLLIQKNRPALNSNLSSWPIL